MTLNNKISQELWLAIINPDLKSDIFKDGILENFDLIDNELKVCIFYESKNESCKGTGLHSPYNYNICELAFMAKEWARDYGFHIYSKTTQHKGIAKIRKNINGGKRKKLICCKIADTEVEAIFDICQWILENYKDLICG